MMLKQMLTAGILFTVSALHAQKTVKNSIELVPQSSIKVFTADEKLSGRALGAKLIYHVNVENNPSPWMRSLSLKSIDIALDYKNMSRIRLNGDTSGGLFGDSFAVLTGLNIALAKLGKTEILFSPAFGLGYLGNTYFTNGNPLIGSHINFSSRASLSLARKLSSTFGLSAGIGILHFSDAGFRVPNSGINSLSLELGLVKSFGADKKMADSLYMPAEHKKHTIDFGLGIGRRGVYRSKESLYRTSLYLGYNYRLNDLIGLSAGTDAVYYSTVFDPAHFGRTYQSKATSYDRWRIGAAIGPDIWFGKLALMAKYGYYLHFNSYENINTYWSIGLKYDVLPWLAVQSKVFVHQTEADFAAFGLILSL